MEGRNSVVEPRVLLTEIDELIANTIRSVLVEHLVDGSRKSFGIGIWKGLIVITENPDMRILVL